MNKPFSLCVLALPVALLAGCGGGGDDDDDDDGNTPPPVTVQQLDRMGRPGINTALIDSSNKDAYNQARDPATWAPLFQADIQNHLVAIDAVEGVSGNALLGDSGALASVLVDDRLVIDTSIPSCNEYLAVELALPDACGGRTLSRDVIDDTLSALVVFVLGQTTVSDNVPLDSTFLPEFPFIGMPN